MAKHIERGNSVQILEKLAGLDAAALAQLTQNAKRLVTIGTYKERAASEQVLLAIGNERRRRNDMEATRKEVAKAAIIGRVNDLGLFDRVLLAFQKMPPEDWEVDSFAARAGTSFEAFSQSLTVGDSGCSECALDDDGSATHAPFACQGRMQ